MRKKMLICILTAVIILSNINIVPSNAAENLDVQQEICLIPLTEDNIIEEYATVNIIRPANCLVDEQEKLPLSPGVLTKENYDLMDKAAIWKTTYSGSDIACFIDLETEYKITHICYFDGVGIETIKVSYGIPFAWEEIFTSATNEYGIWKIEEVDIPDTRYIRIETIGTTSSGITEIGFYGYQVGEDPEAESEFEEDLSNPDFGITVDVAVGSNAFIDDPMNIMSAGGVVREYHNYSWVLDEINKHKFNPSYGGKWNFDDYYKNLKDMGILTFPCIQGTSLTVFNKSANSSVNVKPVEDGADTEDPASYKIHASTMFQYAARYGSYTVDDSKLLLADDQERLSGLGYLTYYENWNEQDKNWEGLDAYFSPYEYSAMTSADYDGHEGILGDTYGIINADPDSKLVMGGLAGGENAVKYLELMKLWFDYNRQDQKMAFDVINFHNYSGAQSPENANLKALCEEISDWRNRYARDKEIWLTEFGWDSNLNSPIAAPDDETQRNWIIRSNLIALSSGIDRIAMYMTRDASYEANPTKYATSGLTKEKGSWEKKASWFGLNTMKEVLTGYQFDEVIREDGEMVIYKFKNSNGNVCYAIWSPTSDGSTVDGHDFSVGEYAEANLTQMETGYNDGIKTKLAIEENMVTIDVTESPVFLTLSEKGKSGLAPTNKLIEIKADMISIEKVASEINSGYIYNHYLSLFDEQSKVVAAPTMDSTVIFDSLVPENVYKAEDFPLIGYIDLGEEYHISNIGIYDTNNIGDIRFYAGEPGNWEAEPFLTTTLNTYNYWKISNVSANTRYIKIVKETGANTNEMAFYGYCLN